MTPTPQTVLTPTTPQLGFFQEQGQHFFMFDSSMAETFTYCPRRGYYSIVLKRRPATESPALRFGGHIHTILAEYYTRLIEGNLDVDVLEEKLQKLFDDTPCATEDWRNAGQAKKVLREYWSLYGADDFKVVTLNGKPLIEVPFVVNLGDYYFPSFNQSLTILYSGRIDLVIQYPDGIFVLDHKTTSMLGDTFWMQFEMSSQMRGYAYGLKAALGFEPVGYVVNALCSRKPTKTGVGVELARQRFFVAEPPGQLDEWKLNTIALAHNFLWLHSSQQYPAYHHNCVGKYGPCPFFKVCSLPPSLRHSAIMSEAFVENDWNPLY